MMLTVAWFAPSVTVGLEDVSLAKKEVDGPAMFLLMMATGMETVDIWLMSGGNIMVCEVPMKSRPSE